MTPIQLEVSGPVLHLVSAEGALPALSALLTVAHVAHGNGPFLVGEPGGAIGITDTKGIPRSTVPPTRCSCAFLKQISVLATGKGETVCFFLGIEWTKKKKKSI